MEISNGNGNASWSVPETKKKRNPFVDVKIGGGLGSIVLVGSVLATTALASAFFSRRSSGKKNGQAENEEALSDVDRSSDNATREANLGEAENQNTNQLPGIEISEEKLEDVSDKPNVESLCAMEKLQNGDAGYCIENVESHEDSMGDEEQGNEINGHFNHAPRVADSGSGEEDYKLDRISGTLDDVSAQLNKDLLCDKINAAIDDSISSVKTIDSLGNPTQDEMSGIEVESIRLKLSYLSQQVENTDNECYIENSQTSIQDEMPEEVEYDIDASEEMDQISLELLGKLLEDRMMKDRYRKPESMMFVANRVTRRRMFIGAVSVATSLAMSNLMGLSFVKLCLIMLITGVLLEIQGGDEENGQKSLKLAALFMVER